MRQKAAAKPVYAPSDKESFFRFDKEALKRIGVILDKIGTSTAISVGAYDFALAQLDR